MISILELDVFKKVAELQVNLVKGGIAYFIVLGDKIVWKCASEVFDLPNLSVGVTPNKNGGAMRAISQKTTITDNLPSHLYGKMIKIKSSPIFDEEKNEVVGAISIAFPREHSVIDGFSHYAPIFAEIFPEGVFIYTTDTQKITNVQGSNKFNLEKVNVGYELKETDIAYKTIKSQRINQEYIENSRYGVPTLIINSPLFDDEDGSLVGTLGVVIPRAIEHNLLSLAETLKENLIGISSGIQEMAAASFEIQNNEKVLNENIQEILNFVEEIAQISIYIKKIADQTNMLGLNASIEASRVGEMGRGFSVVASEIRKLSENTKDTAPKIRNIIDKINDKVDTLIKKSSLSLTNSENQTSAMQEINAGIEEITAMSEELEALAKSLS